MRQNRSNSRPVLRVLASLVLAAGLVFGVASAATADNDIGCGVGTAVWEGKSGLGFKLLGSCTNGITFQSISITFGLLNCDGRGTITAFTGANLDHLAAEMSTGEGETLTALGTLLEIQDEDRQRFYTLTQQNFAELFPSDTTTAGEMLSNLDALLSGDARLSVYARS